MKYYVTEINAKGNIAVDDTLLVKGAVTSAGSRILEGFKPLFSAEAVERLEYVGEAEVNGMTLCETRGIVKGENVPAMVLDTGIFVATGMTTLTEDHMKGAPDVLINFWIDEETGHVHKISLDGAAVYQKIADNMFELVKDVEGFEGAAALGINRYALTYEISQINEVEKVDFPADLDSAVDLDALNAETAQ